MRKTMIAILGAAMLVPAAASATAPVADTAVPYEREDDDADFPWGLLGLIGLAGLLGRKRDHDHVHVDRRDDIRPRV